MIQFRAYLKPEPQGSMQAFVRGKRAVLVSDNRKLDQFREELAQYAIEEVGPDLPAFTRHVPIALRIGCGFIKPKSAKRRTQHVVKPDADKLARAIMDALTGVLFHDDAQVVHFSISKVYADCEYVDVSAWEVCE